MTYLSHFGVYGICIKDGKLLCVRKNRDLTRGVMTYRVVVRNPGKVYWKHLREN